MNQQNPVKEKQLKKQIKLRKKNNSQLNQQNPVREKQLKKQIKLLKNNNSETSSEEDPIIQDINLVSFT